jgi:hypothetical protein
MASSSWKRMILESATGSLIARANSRQKCSFSTWPWKCWEGGLRIWVVGTRPEGTPQRPFSKSRAVLG